MNRPAPKPIDFKFIAPKEYADFKQGGLPNWPCNKPKVPVQSVHMWKQRALFVRLLTTALKGIEEIRDFDCTAPGNPYHNAIRKFTWTEVLQLVANDRVATAAVNYLRGIAFANFVCA